MVQSLKPLISSGMIVYVACPNLLHVHVPRSSVNHSSICAELCLSLVINYIVPYAVKPAYVDTLKYRDS